jgi:hypothetical protein
MQNRYTEHHVRNVCSKFNEDSQTQPVRTLQGMSMKVHYYTREHKITSCLYATLQKLDQVVRNGWNIKNIGILVQTPERKSQIKEHKHR